MSRRLFMNPDLTYEQRLHSIEAYLRVLAAKELIINKTGDVNTIE